MYNFINWCYLNKNKSKKYNDKASKGKKIEQCLRNLGIKTKQNKQTKNYYISHGINNHTKYR